MGVSVAICYSPGLGYDLDTIDDLESYEHMEPGLLQRLAPNMDMTGLNLTASSGGRSDSF
jgi:TATA-binding protein-associated factor Taf7